MTADILDLIDGAVRAHETWPDAMRWTDDPQAHTEDDQALIADFAGWHQRGQPIPGALMPCQARHCDHVHVWSWDAAEPPSHRLLSGRRHPRLSALRAAYGRRKGHR